MQVSWRGRRLAAWIVAAVLLVAAAAGCSSLRYYGQAAIGGASILVKRKPVERWLKRRDLDPAERRRLELALEIRRFASEELGLPDNRSYRSYVRTGKQAVVWNVIAAPELSVEPVRWCFLFAGCVSYRGYFREQRARRFAERLERDGYDVAVFGAAAYSTLGWFADPLLDTFLRYPEWRLAGLIFHELAHQVVYVKGDTTFNESFATAVEELGVERWLSRRGRSELSEKAGQARREERIWARLRLDARRCLATVYERPERSDDWKRDRKQRVFQKLDAELDRLRGEGVLGARWQSVSAAELNNADLAAVADYESLAPGFVDLFESVDGDFGAFYEVVGRLAELGAEERASRLEVRAACPGSPSAEGYDCPPF